MTMNARGLQPGFLDLLLGLDNGKRHRREAGEAERLRRRRRHIDDAAFNERAAVVDHNRDRLAVALVGDGDMRAERQRAMRGSEAVEPEPLAARLSAAGAGAGFTLPAAAYRHER